MRTTTGADSYLLSSIAKKHCLKVEVSNGGYWYNLSNLEGYDFVISASWGVLLDEPLSTANIELFGHIYNYSLAPDVSLSRMNRFSNSPLLVLSAKIRIMTATVPIDSIPDDTDWKSVFQGYITKIDVKDNGDKISLYCRDLASKIQDAFIRTEYDYGADDGSKISEDVIQDILDEWGLNVTLYTPSSPSFIIKKYVQQKQSVLDAVRDIAIQTGFDIRYKWRESSSQWEFTYYEPDREKTTIDYSFGHNTYILIPNITYDLASIRNLIRINFASAGDSGTATGAGPSNNTLADTSKSWTTNEFLGDQIVLTGGTGAGQERTITYHDNQVVTVDTNWGTNPDSTTTYVIAKRLKSLDYPEWGTATAGAANTITDSSKSWTTNMWAGYKVRIVGGTGISQELTISSNTYTALTVSSNWTVNPASGSKYAIYNSADSAATLEWYGQRFMEVTEGASSQIDTKTEARNMARAIYNDLSYPYTDLQIELDYFWPVELGDVYLFESNKEIFDNDLQLAVVGFTHNLSSTNNKTTLQLRGKPAGYKLGWFHMAAEPGVAPVRKIPVTPSWPGSGYLTTGVEKASTYSYVKVKWNYNSELDLDYYLVRYQRAGAEWSYMSIPATYNTVKIPFLVNATSYTFQVCAVNKTAKSSDWSSAQSITTS